MLKLSRLQKINCFLWCLLLFCYSCKTDKTRPVDSGKHIVNIPNISIQKPLDLDEKVYALKYLPVGISNENFVVNQIRFNSNFIYMLNKKVAKLYIQNRETNNVMEIDDVTSFQLDDNCLFTYSIRSGKLSKFSISGSLQRRNKLGFRGVDFAALNDSTFVFYTGGLITDDEDSEKFELSFVNLKGILLNQTIPISEDKQGANYISQNRFSKNNVTVFIPSLSSQSFIISKHSARKSTTLDFGVFNLTDSVFSNIKDVEDYSFFPYVLNVTNKFNTPEISFFSYTYNGVEGYLFVQKKDKKILLAGLKSSAGPHSHYLDIVPLDYHEGEFLSYSDLQTNQNDYTFNPSLKKIPSGQVTTKRYFIFYKLKGIK